MKKYVLIIIVLAALVLSAGCASNITYTKWPVQIVAKYIDGENLVFELSNSEKDFVLQVNESIYNEFSVGDRVLVSFVGGYPYYKLTDIVRSEEQI